MSTNIECEPTGISRGRERFPSRQDAPRVRAWRCDLTALSQQRNLYFVAYNDEVHVHQPSFPRQELSDVPSMVIRPPISGRGLSPGIDFDNPHSITRISVDYLGRDEILLMSCDDGDVIGYWVKDIQRVVDTDSDAKRAGVDSIDASLLKHFFHENAGASAWGLAVHHEARMIAISSNTHNVLVYAFALAQPRSNAAQHDFPNVSEEEPEDFPLPRRRNHTLVLAGRSNLPSISFNNTGEDPAGRWLYSSGIDGSTMLWDLHDKAQNPARTIQLGFCVSTDHMRRAPPPHDLAAARCKCSNKTSFPHGAWGALFLDIKAAFPIGTAETTVRELDEERFSLNQENEMFKYMNHQKKRFKNSTVVISGWDMYSDVSDSDDEVTTEENHAELHDASGSEPDSGMSLQLGSGEDDDSNEENSDGMSIDGESPTHVTGTDATSEPVPQDDLSTASTEADPSESLFVPEQPVTNNTVMLPPHLQPLIETFPGGFMMASNTNGSGNILVPLPGLNSTSPATGLLCSPHTKLPRPYIQFTNSTTLENQDDKKSPCLIITKEEIYLLQGPFDSRLDYQEPVVCIRQPLHPAPWSPFLGSADRMCFFTQVPELAIFVVASPIGRAAIFSITRPPHGTPSKPKGLQYGFQLEYVLPFDPKDPMKIQHNAGIGARLIGVAVGPMQGSLSHDGDVERYRKAGCMRKRWRLMMYYTDHTVLSYEVSKKKKTATPDLDELIV